MNKKEKVQYIIDELERLYPTTPIPLVHHNAYTLLVAVVLSAQSTDKKVNEITPFLFDRADNPYDMADLEVGEIKELIKQIGLSNSKAKAIKSLSEKIVEEHKGEVPNNFEDLENLAGVGHKTASVVMSQAYGHPAFPVDTHIHRLMYRWGLSNGKNVIQTEKDAKRLFPRELWNKLHLQIIFYGREYSPARFVKADVDFISVKVGRKSEVRKMLKSE